MAELVDAADLKSAILKRCMGSSPFNTNIDCVCDQYIFKEVPDMGKRIDEYLDEMYDDELDDENFDEFEDDIDEYSLEEYSEDGDKSMWSLYDLLK